MVVGNMEASPKDYQDQSYCNSRVTLKWKPSIRRMILSTKKRKREEAQKNRKRAEADLDASTQRKDIGGKRVSFLNFRIGSTISFDIILMECILRRTCAIMDFSHW